MYAKLCVRCSPIDGRRHTRSPGVCEACGSKGSTAIVWLSKEELADFDATRARMLRASAPKRVAPAELWGMCSGVDDPMSYNRAALVAIL